MIQPDSILRIAFRDIHKYLEKKHNISISGGKNNNLEYLIVKRHVDTKETHNLNKLLKVRGFNMNQENMNRY